MRIAEEGVREAGIAAIAAVEVAEWDWDEVQDLVQVLWTSA